MRLRLTRRTGWVVLVLAVLALAGTACAEEGGELFGDAENDPSRGDGAVFDEEEVFGEPSSFEGDEVVVSARVDEVVAPGLFLLERGDHTLLVAASSEEPPRLREAGVAHVEGRIEQLDFEDIEAAFPGSVGHDVLDDYEGTAFIDASEVFMLDDEDDG